jgi:hypothetical protein
MKAAQEDGAIQVLFGQLRRIPPGLIALAAHKGEPCYEGQQRATK